MHIASWNVAGWLTTVRHVKANHGSVDAWLGRHAFDVLCLQEVKTNDRNIEQQPREHAAAPSGFDSFWAPSRLRNAKGGFAGMAGVATFVRQGLCHHASRNVLDGGGALDSEGRCILTCIGNIAVFNVYTPNDGAFSVNLPLKIAFLRALRSAMSGMRAQGFCVVLCGDLNLSYRSADVCPGDRRVDVAECLRRGQAGAAGNADPVAEICAQLAEAHSLKSQRCIERENIYSQENRQSENFCRFSPCVPLSLCASLCVSLSLARSHALAPALSRPGIPAWPC